MDRLGRLRPALSLASALLLLVGLLPTAVNGATVWRYNLFRSSGFLYQDPYYTACTAAAAMMMLNFIDLADTGGDGFKWRLFRTKNASDPRVTRDMTSILSFERSHDTLAVGSRGSDAHGWRNALNYYGWGSAAMIDPARRVYDDRAYSSFDAALKGAVTSIARYHKPVGLLAWAGGHAQVITGYVVTGEDPATSDAFVVNGLYISDPLRSNSLVNRSISRLSLLQGSLRFRFRSYREIDSPLDDPYSAGWRRSSVRSMTSEWYARWVLVQPIRAGLPVVTPPPDPTPTPTPPPDPSPEPSADPTSAPTVESTPEPSATPTPTATVTPDPTATPAPTATPEPTPTSTPTSEVTTTASDPSATPEPAGSTVP
jgi:hypothetical protein